MDLGIRTNMPPCIRHSDMDYSPESGAYSLIQPFAVRAARLLVHPAPRVRPALLPPGPRPDYPERRLFRVVDREVERGPPPASSPFTQVEAPVPRRRPQAAGWDRTSLPPSDTSKDTRSLLTPTSAEMFENPI